MVSKFFASDLKKGPISREVGFGVKYGSFGFPNLTFGMAADPTYKMRMHREMP